MSNGAREFAAVIKHAAADITSEAEKVVFKGATNVKKEMQRTISSSTHFKGAAPSVTFDMDGLSAEIGPEKASGAGGAIMNIGYFGGVRGGGGTVEDPEEPLIRETPNVQKWLADAAYRSFG